MAKKLTAKQTKEILRRHADGITVEQMAKHLAGTGDNISVACIRKYVQMGILERSERRGGGYRQGSKGYYPASAMVQLMNLRLRMKDRDRTQPLAEVFAQMVTEKRLCELETVLDQSLSHIMASAKKNGQLSSVRPAVADVRKQIALGVGRLRKVAVEAVSA